MPWVSRLTRRRKVYETIHTLHQEKGYEIASLCALSGIPRSSYYKWLHREESASEKENTLLLEEIIRLYSEVKGIYGYAGMSPSTYQSGQLSLSGTYSHMEKRGSRYLRYALYNATKYVCHWDPTFEAYLAKKREEGKHYNVALSHATKKLVRLIYAMEKSHLPYNSAA